MLKQQHTGTDANEMERISREVVQSYIVTTAMYDYSVYEKRVLYNLVKLAQSQIEGVKLSDSLYRIDHSLRDFIRIELPVSDFLTGSDDKHHARVKEALQSLHRKTFTYQDAKVWECFSIIANPKIELRSSRVSFYVNTRVWDVLLDFSKGFSRYDLEVAFRLESPYAMRFYEMLCCQQDPITLPIAMLRKTFALEGKYSENKDFIRRVVESAKSELDAKSPVTFTYKPIKEGRRFSQIMLLPVRQDKHRSSDSSFRESVRRYGSSPVLSGEEYRTLTDIGFSDSGINANLRLFMRCKRELDFRYELSMLQGQCRTKQNPCGWCIEALRGKLDDACR